MSPEQEREAIRDRVKELGLEPIRHADPSIDVQLQAAYIHTIETVITERALDRLTAQQKRIADMLKGIVEEGWVISVSNTNHY